MKPLPQPLTRFVGRKAEIERILQQLRNPDCRLLTLVGVGGIGKTRLSIEAAHAYAKALDCDVHFVNLQATQYLEQLPSEIADAMGLSLTGSEPLTAQLCQQLAGQNGLIVLDNFEQFLTGTHQQEAVALTSLILREAAQIKLLITSREPLEIIEEWLYPVGGLTHSAEMPIQSDAAQLFVRSALRVRPNFTADNQAADIAKLCTLVDGMPLAIELAASWTKSLGVAEIIEELSESSDLLATNLHNLPQRHRSIETIIDQTWSRLSEHERSAFAKLSVFRGGFQRQAAKKVAGASIPLLAALLDKSLLRWEQDKRYQIHELLRQYASRQLGANEADMHGKHAAYYATLAESFQDPLIAVDQETHDAFHAELDNFRAAWRWALQHRAVDALFPLAIGLATFLGMRNLNVEYVDTFEAAADQLATLPNNRHANEVRAYLLCCAGKAHMRMGHIEEADLVLKESEAIYASLDVPHAPGLATDPTIFLSIVSYMRSEFELGIEQGERALAVAKAQGHERNMAYAYNMISGSQSALNRVDEAEQNARASLEIVQRLGARDHLAFAHTEMAKIEKARGALSSAENHIRAAIRVRRENRQINGEAMALSSLAYVQLAQERPSDAAESFTQALGLHNRARDVMGMQSCLTGLGSIALEQGQLAESRQYYLDALEIGLAQNLVTYSGATLVGVGKLLCATGETERGSWLLSSLASIATLSPKTQQRARVAKGNAPNPNTPLGTDVMSLMEQMRHELPKLELAKQPHTVTSSAPDQSELVEPLTPRELEILQGICTGKTNRMIAEDLFLSIGTVKWYSQQIYGKLGVKNRTQATIRAQELALAE